jgi:GNAT superfamily N-acetyltransferase
MLVTIAGMDPLPLRPAEPKDIDAIVRLVNLAFLAERPYIEGERVNAEGVREMLTKGTFLLAEQEGALVACVFVSAQGERAHLGLVSVDPARQGAGLGSQLMAAVELYCRAAGYGEMELRFINHRSELLRFYQRQGFAETGVTEILPDVQRIKIPFHFVQMCKRLD